MLLFLLLFIIIFEKVFFDSFTEKQQIFIIFFYWILKPSSLGLNSYSQSFLFAILGEAMFIINRRRVKVFQKFIYFMTPRYRFNIAFIISLKLGFICNIRHMHMLFIFSLIFTVYINKLLLINAAFFLKLSFVYFYKIMFK